MNEPRIKQKIIETLQSNSWQHVKYKDLNKEPEELILKEIFFEKIRQLNRDVELTEKDLQEAINKLLNGTRKEILRYLKEGVPIILEKYGYKKTLKIIDYENLQNNSFIVSDEVIFKFADKIIKPDVVLFVNGIPLVAIEAESTEENEWDKGFQQLVNYAKTIPRLFNIIQIGIVVADNIYYFAFDEEIEKEKVDELKKKLYIWKPDEDRKTKDWEKIFNATVGFMLKPEILLKIVKYYTFYLKKREIKILPRYYQFYTVEKLFEKFVERLEGKDEEKSWTVWHYQGSGKSLTMVYLSYSILKRLDRKLAPEPVVLIVVDRLELQKQIDERFFKNIDLELGYNVNVIKNLKELIVDVFRRGEQANPGVYITTIQKFRKDSIEEDEEMPINIDKEIDETLKELKLSKSTIDRIANKKDVFILIDEAHRSHYGDLNKILAKIFGSAFWIAFTGTPLIEKDKNTFDKFGKPIDIYFIDEAESDGFVLSIFYKADYEIISLTLEKFAKLKREEYEHIIDKILQGELTENLDELEKSKLSELIQRKLSNIKRLIFENEERIKEIAKIIAEHYKKEVEPLGFKALVITATRKAAVKYVEELKELLGDDNVEAIITYEASEDDELIIKYREKLIQRYGKGIRDYNELNEIIKRKFQKEETPKILVVVNKLITGFDEKKIQTIYIDRLMSGHTLLQAIGRCNRRFDEKGKQNGLVVDFVGIIDRLKRALSLYFAEKKIQVENLVVLNYTRIDEVLSNILEHIDQKIFRKIEKDLTQLVGLFGKYTKNKDIDSMKNLIDEVVSLILENNLDKIFNKLFNQFESNLFSPVVDINTRRKYYSIYTFLLLIKLQLKAIEAAIEERRLPNIYDLKRIASIKADEILKEIYKNTVIQEFLSIEKKELAEIIGKIDAGDYISILDLNNLNRYPEIEREVRSKEALSKTVKAMVILKEKEPTYSDIIDKVLRKVQDYNRKKYRAYLILQEILSDIEKIQQLEDTKKKYGLDKDGLFIYKLLLKNLEDVKQETLIKLSRDIYSKISEALKYRDRNDFCRILNRRIRLGVLLAMNKVSISKDTKEEIIKELKKYFANNYKECEEILLK